MVSKTLLGIAAIIAVPTAIAGGYFLPHPHPEYVDPYDLPPPSIVELPAEVAPNKLPKRLVPQPVQERTVARV